MWVIVIFYYKCILKMEYIEVVYLFNNVYIKFNLYILNINKYNCIMGFSI